MKDKKIAVIFFFFILCLIILSVFVIALCHDIKIDEGYGVNGIKIRYNALDITDDPAYLIIGNSYELKTKGKNLGDFDESVYFEIVVVDSVGYRIADWDHTYSLNIGQSKYVPSSGWEDWDTTGLAVGEYVIIANASISEVECDYSNNERIRIVRLDYDEDNDKVVDNLDKCPDSKAGEDVDEQGCDPFQFCEKFYCSSDCFYADWKNNEQEKRYPNDCTVVIVLREGKHYPKCVPLSCAD